MRNFLVILFSFFLIQVNGQSFVTYKDTINRFSINIPSGWKYGVNKDIPELILIAYKTPLNQMDSSRDNFVGYLGDAKNFKIIEKGDTTFNGTKFKWLIETHQNENSDTQMHNYDFVTLKDGKTYILTMFTFSRTFDDVKPLLIKIASSFALLD